MRGHGQQRALVRVDVGQRRDAAPRAPPRPHAQLGCRAPVPDPGRHLTLLLYSQELLDKPNTVRSLGTYEHGCILYMLIKITVSKRIFQFISNFNSLLSIKRGMTHYDNKTY